MGKMLLGAAAALTALGIATAANAGISLAITSGPNFDGFNNATVGDTSGTFDWPGWASSRG